MVALEEKPGTALVEEESTQPPESSLEDVLGESLDVLPVGAPPDDSVPPGLVGYGASPECSACKQDRAKQGLPPRQLVRLPSSITDHSVFKKHLPLMVCEFCDGDVLKLATKKASDD